MDEKIKHDIINGLTSTRKYFDLFFHWNEEGSRLFDIKIEECKWYYNHRFEVKLLQSISQTVINNIECHTMLVDLGSGNATKTRLFLDQLLKNNESLIYAPVDISEEHLQKIALKIQNEYGGRLDVKPFACDYLEAFKSIRKFKENKLFVWFGALQNFTYKDQIDILKRMSNYMKTYDRLFVTVDGTDHTRKREIKLAYLDPDGHNGRFHTNAIEWLNAEYDGNIDVSKFDFNDNFVAKKARDCCSFIEIWMEALEQCDFDLEKINLKIRFEKGEKMFFHKNKEYSCKYTVEQIKHICEEGTFRVVEHWVNEHVIGLLLQKK